MVNSYIFSFSGIYSFSIYLSLDEKDLTALIEKKDPNLILEDDEWYIEFKKF